ncbi:L,D-transpeptidase family protein [Streptomyces sp. NPDC000941]
MAGRAPRLVVHAVVPYDPKIRINSATVGIFGKINGSHGCISMSTEDAKWFHDRVHFGNPVTVVDSEDTVAVNNGYVDWATWQDGSALK